MAQVNNLIVNGTSRLLGTAYGSKFVVNNGSSSQFMKADGSLDSSQYLTSSSLNGYVTQTSLSANSYVTQTQLNNAGYTTNVGTITGINMNGASKGTSGVVDLGTVITSETQLSKGTTSGSGNAVTDISVSGHTITLTKGTTFVTSVKTTDDNTWIQATPTSATSGAVTIDIQHIGPGAVSKTLGPVAGSTLAHSGTFSVPKFSYDSKGHIISGETVTYTLPAATTIPTHYNLAFQNNAGTQVDIYKPTTSPSKTLKAGTDLEISASSNVITVSHSGTGRNKPLGLYKIKTDAAGHVTETASPSTGSPGTTIGMKYVPYKTNADDFNSTWLSTIGTAGTATNLVSTVTGTFVTNS